MMNIAIPKFSPIDVIFHMLIHLAGTTYIPQRYARFRAKRTLLSWAHSAHRSLFVSDLQSFQINMAKLPREKFCHSQYANFVYYIPRGKKSLKNQHQLPIASTVILSKFFAFFDL